MKKKTGEFTCFIPEKKCHKCGKIFIPGAEHIYKDHAKWYCCWTCYLHRRDPVVKPPLAPRGRPIKEEFTIPKENPFIKTKED